MITEQHSLFDCNLCLFKQISCRLIKENEFEIIRRTSHQMKYQKGEMLLKQGAKSTGLVYLHKGIVKFTYKSDDGGTTITTVVKGPKLLGGANLLFKDINIFNIIAVEDCDICNIDSKALRTVAVRNGNYMLALFEQTVNMFQTSIFNFISLARKHVYGRIADILLYLRENVYNNNEYEFELSRKEISEFAACSHENVITTLSKLNKEGIIALNGKNIQIVDINRLKEISKRG
jgi:CRP-like cAMP-binding protein